MDPVDGRYVKRLKPGTKDPLPEKNWVWSPQGAINMHMPERWGHVQFSGKPAGSGTDAFVDDPNERVKWALRRLYYRQGRFRAANGAYASTPDALKASDIVVDSMIVDSGRYLDVFLPSARDSCALRSTTPGPSPVHT